MAAGARPPHYGKSTKLTAISAIIRWIGPACIEAEKHSHRVRDHKGLKILVAALRREDRDAVASERKVA